MMDQETEKYIDESLGEIQFLFNKRIEELEDIMRQELKKLNRFFWFGSALAIIYTIKLFIGG